MRVQLQLRAFSAPAPISQRGVLGFGGPTKWEDLGLS